MVFDWSKGLIFWKMQLSRRSPWSDHESPKICVLLGDKKQWQLTHNGRKQGFPLSLGRTSSSCSRWIPALDACKWKSNDQVIRCAYWKLQCYYLLLRIITHSPGQLKTTEVLPFCHSKPKQKLRINYLKQINWKQRFEKTCPSKT